MRLGCANPFLEPCLFVMQYCSEYCPAAIASFPSVDNTLSEPEIAFSRVAGWYHLFSILGRYKAYLVVVLLLGECEL